MGKKSELRAEIVENADKAVLAAKHAKAAARAETKKQGKSAPPKKSAE